MFYLKNLCCFLILFALASTCACNKSSPNAAKAKKTNGPPPKLELELTLDLENVVGIIDDLCYGINSPLIPEAPVRRIGGNRLTGYNWEINSSNAGIDSENVSDRWLNKAIGLKNKDNQPAAFIIETVKLNQSESADSMVTVPLAGFVSADATGQPVSWGDTAPSKRWEKVEPTKPGGDFGDPDLRDGKVFVDEEVAWLVSKFGTASEGGIKYYSLDNEPGYWSTTHPRLHPEKASYEEVVDKSIATADAILAVDPDAEIVGPALYGWFAHDSLQKAPDKNRFNKKYQNFSAYYLSRMREASEEKGKRLLHMFDFHWYPEAMGGGHRIAFGGTQDSILPDVVAARLQAPRSLWDPTYVEDSWITKENGNVPIELIPRMQKIIEKNYPETRLAILEYHYGAPHHISGGLATTDVLGIFGRYGVAGCQWSVNDNNRYEQAAFRLYLNYDGKGARFEENAIGVSTTAAQHESIYAACSEDKQTVTVVLINKQSDHGLKKQIRFKGIKGVPALRAFRLGTESSEVRKVTEDLEAIEGGFEINCPPFSATLVELKL